MVMNDDNKKIVLPEELQKEMMKFFMRTSIPRKARQKREQEKIKALSDKEGKENK